MAFRWSGKNWEGRAWNTPVSLRSLGGQVDAEYPTRPRTTDGTVASKQHDATSPNSDHRPTPHSGPGIVRGIDVTVTRAQGDQITEALRLSRDPRIKYLIWNRQSFRPPSWEWRLYTLSPHDHHFHLSTQTSQDNNSEPWQLGQQATPPEEPTMYAAVKEGDKGEAVEAWQRVMQRISGFAPAAWGVFGADTTTELVALTGPGNNIGPSEGAVLLEKLGQADAGGLSEDQVRAIINGSQIVAPT